MDPSDRAVLTAFARSLRRELPDCEIRAFGSRARGDASPDSDLDVCVVAESLDRATRELISRVAWETGFEHDVLIATMKYTRDAFDRFPGSASPLVATIRREGVPA